jgi:hypothetical protein
VLGVPLGSGRLHVFADCASAEVLTSAVTESAAAVAAREN